MTPTAMRRTLVPALVLAALLAPAAGAAELEQLVLLHELGQGLHITPDQMNAAPGDTIKMTVTNQGETPHNLYVCADAGQSPASPPGECRQLGGFTPDLAKDESAPLTFAPPDAGTYWYYCNIPGHKPAGMAGRLVVAGAVATEKETPAPLAWGAMAALAAAALLLRRRA